MKTCTDVCTDRFRANSERERFMYLQHSGLLNTKEGAVYTIFDPNGENACL